MTAFALTGTMTGHAAPESLGTSLFEPVAPKFHGVPAYAFGCGNPSDGQSLSKQQNNSAPTGESLGRRSRAGPFLEPGHAVSA
jgi:hypothetical protein